MTERDGASKFETREKTFLDGAVLRIRHLSIDNRLEAVVGFKNSSIRFELNPKGLT